MFKTEYTLQNFPNSFIAGLLITIFLMDMVFILCLAFTLQMASSADDFAATQTAIVAIISKIAQKPIDNNATAITQLLIDEVDRLQPSLLLSMIASLTAEKPNLHALRILTMLVQRIEGVESLSSYFATSIIPLLAECRE